MIGHKTIKNLQDLEDYDQEFEEKWKVLFLCEGGCGKKYLGASMNYERVLYASTLEDLEPNSSKCYSGSGPDWVEHKKTCNHKHTLTIKDTTRDLKKHQKKAIDLSYKLSSGNENVHVGDCEIFLNNKIESGVGNKKKNKDEDGICEHDVLNYVEDIPLEKVYVSETEINPDNKSPEDVTIDNNLNETMTRVLSKLKAREERLLRLRFGIGIGVRTSHTLSDIAESLGVIPERARQIEAKAFRRLKHPLLSGRLVHFMSENFQSERRTFLDEATRKRRAAGKVKRYGSSRRAA